MNKKMSGLAAMLAAALLLSIGLAGCGQEDGGVQEGIRVVGGGENLTPDGEAFETVYVPGIFEFDRPMNYPISFATSPRGLYVRDMDDETYEFDAQGHFLRALGQVPFNGIAPDGTLWKLDGVENRGGPNNGYIDYTLFRLDESGGETEILRFRTEQGTAALIAADEQLLITKQYWDEENTGHFSLEVYDTSGNLLHTGELSEWFELRRDGAELYFTGRDSYDIFVYDGESFALNRVDSVDEDCYLCGINQGQLYLSDGVCVYRRPIGGGEREALFRYDKLYLSGQSAPVPIGGSDSFFFFDIRNEASPYRMAYPVDKNSLPAEKTQLVLAINEAIPEDFYNQYGRYQEEILDFNTVNLQYEIVVKNYADCPDPQAALNADIAAGAAPDIVDMGGFDAGMLTAANCVDLLPYMERDVGTDCLLQGPLKAMLTEGKLLSLIPSFSITAILGPASLLEGQTVESFADLAALAGGGERVFASAVTRGDFLLWVFANNKRDYTAEQVEDILRFAALLPETLENTAEEEMPDMVDHEQILNGEQCFELVNINGPIWSSGDTSTVGLAGEELFFGEKLRFQGLPDGGQGQLFIRPDGELMIPLNAANREGAWTFLQFVLSDRYLVSAFGNTVFLRGGIPITVSALAPVTEAAKNSDGVLRWNEVEYSYDPLYYGALFQNLLDGVDGICRGGDELYDIVNALAQSYFSGDKTLEQVSADIASRLSLYKAELG